jgi:NAD(P)-dependent dehydrogenase (short-subunit alcohol dehydrogenase family)
LSAHQWTPDDIPDLNGKRALVTGVTSGLGEHTALALARRGAEVVMVGRNSRKLDRTIADVHRAVPAAPLHPVIADLADLASVRRAAATASTYGPLDILINNAGVMATPHRRTADGFELQLGTNHLGHFALTGLLLPQLVASGDARVVTVSSQAHRTVRSVPLTDPRLDQGHYQKWIAYGRSKLANLLFAFELDRRATAAGLPIVSVAAHPGYASTNLVASGLNLGRPRPDGVILAAATRLVGQSAEMGAMPSLMAGTVPGLPGSSFVGPRGFAEARGLPSLVGASKPARDERLAAGLWQVSMEATGVVYP